MFPATQEDRKRLEGQTYGSANGTGIKTFGTREIMLHFGDGHHFTQTFLIADVTQPMLGFDFFEDNRLKIDVEDRTLEYKEDGRMICSVVEDEFRALLDKYPQLFVQDFSNSLNKHQVEHYIEIRCASRCNH